MATQLEYESDDELEPVETEQDNDEAEGAHDEAGEAGDDEQTTSSEYEDEDVISFAGIEQRDEDEPEHIRELRQRYRETKRENEQLRAAQAPKAEDAGPEPKLDDYWDHDDPEGDYNRDRDAWKERKAQATEREQAQREEAEAAQKEWESDFGAFQTQRTSLKVRDFDAAYDRVTGSLNEVQQAILVQAATNKAALAYALGKNPDKLAEIAGIKNPVKFTAAIARLDMETKVQKRKPTTLPEDAQRGSGPIGGRDQKLERLQREASQTGDRSKLIAYKKENGLL